MTSVPSAPAAAPYAAASRQAPSGARDPGDLPPDETPPPEAWRVPRTPVFAFAMILLGWLAGAVRVDGITPAMVWGAGLVLGGGPLVWRTARSVAGGHFATDVVAALAMVGALLIGQPLAGLVVVLMQSGGEALERYAAGRASSAIRALEAGAPRLAHRLEGGVQVDVRADDVAVGDLLLVRPGELVPCDGVVEDGHSHLDLSRLTGESLPERAAAGTKVMSGAANLEGPFTMRATALARESQYARIVELVRSAQAHKAPLQRLADRYAAWFTPATLVVGLAAWLLSGDASRIVAVLVVATPCPLILAVPVAIVGGIARAARRQIVVRHGGALERLATVHAVVLDKTGTLTIGLPAVREVRPLDGRAPLELLALIAAVEQGSGHLLARTVLEAARDAGLAIPAATGVREEAGRGVEGRVGDRLVAIGSRRFIEARLAPGIALPPHEVDGSTALEAYVAIDGRPAGVVAFADRVRADAPAFLAELSRFGVRRVRMLSGDGARHTRAVADALGIADAVGELLPADKVREVQRLVAEEGDGVLMVGDGTNDAPALSAATVGIAMAAHGGGIAAESADAVVLGDDLGRVAEVLRIGRRTIRVARESIWAGLGLSGAGMIVAAFGYLSPVRGALLQEAIDIAVILNALRASMDPKGGE